MSLWYERQIAKGDVDYDPEYDAAYRIDPDPLRPFDDTVALEDDVHDDEPWEPAEQPEPAPVLEVPEVNGLATHLCSFDRCFPAPCADHLSTAGAALKWMANRAGPREHAAYERGIESVRIEALTEEPNGLAASQWRQIFEEGIAHGYKIANDDPAFERGKAEGIAEGESERAELRGALEETRLLLEQAERYARDLQDDGVIMPERGAAKASIHPVLHDLDVRINNLRGDCHCSLIAEVVLDALYGVGAEVVVDAGAEPTGGSDAA